MYGMVIWGSEAGSLKPSGVPWRSYSLWVGGVPACCQGELQLIMETLSPPRGCCLLWLRVLLLIVQSSLSSLLTMMEGAGGEQEGNKLSSELPSENGKTRLTCARVLAREHSEI